MDRACTNVRMYERFVYTRFEALILCFTIACHGVVALVGIQYSFVLL